MGTKPPLSSLFASLSGVTLGGYLGDGMIEGICIDWTISAQAYLLVMVADEILGSRCLTGGA